MSELITEGPLTSEPELKQIGKYTIDRRLGGGGMAEVYLGHLVGAEGFSRPVAIKRVLPSHSDDGQFTEMFVKEANLTARLSHQNLVSVLDFDRDPVHGFYLVMELVKGCDLSRLMATGPLPVPVAIHLTSEVLAGLGYAHHLPVNDLGICGLVHRDISPHNVLLSWDGAVKVADFGIAKAHGAANATASIMVKGKLAYMSPEQANGRPLDGRSDLFAVGVMLWEMLTGQKLFLRSSPQESLSALLVHPIPSPREIRREIPADIAAVTMRLLQRNVSSRIANADRAMQELRQCRDTPPDGRACLISLLQEKIADAPRSPTAPTRAVALSDLPLANAPSVPLVSRGRSSSRGVVIATVIAVALAALGATGGWLWSRQRAPIAREAPPPATGSGRMTSIPSESATTTSAAVGSAGSGATETGATPSGARTSAANATSPARAAKAAPKKARRESAPSGILKVQVVDEPEPPARTR
jgi:serine/threonine protein kinase